MNIFLECVPTATTATWTCRAISEITLKSEGGTPLVRELAGDWRSGEAANSHGVSPFISWSNLIDPNKSYIVNEIFTVEAYIQLQSY